MEGKKICVTGAGGYIASWLVKLLLSKGYTINGTVRDPDNEKNDHLKKLDMASENLQLFKADVLSYGELFEAIQGCEGVFHVASPVPGFKRTDMITPALTGTLNVLKACSEVGIKRVLLVSSSVTILRNSSWPKDRVMDESCWSEEHLLRETEVAVATLPPDRLIRCFLLPLLVAVWPLLSLVSLSRDLSPPRLLLAASSFIATVCRKPARSIRYICGLCALSPSLLHWYGLSKTLAERAAWEYSKNTGLNMVTVCPSMVYGPLLQSTVNATSLMLLNIVKGTSEPMVDKLWHFVDVRDVADALLLVYETAEASGRYICAAHPSYLHEIITKLKSIYPDYKYQQNFTELGPEYRLSSEKLKTLGWKARALEETLVDSVEFFRQAGLLEEVAA
ncbi:Tetraketide alpha-pyrone reductase 1 [Platanthera guangdongensis]|uniref:Tetraketide alpha-pyrone reductase 1 n=1 Tax=Platanthera guangdongensis TaxID=2320717 RepID=A0ABR2LUU7_9ASPA